MVDINKLLKIMARLRDPDEGCPWDLEQNFHSIAPYTIEEAYEVADAIDRKDLDDLKDELGDLLLQVVFHAQIAKESCAFDFADVVDAIADKMIRRHPHVFDGAQVGSAAAQTQAWEAHKTAERAAQGESRVLAGISLSLPALLRAEKLSKRASRVGFDWPSAEGARDKVLEELQELDEARSKHDQTAINEEIGDLLFAVTNLARKCSVNAEEALRLANRKFQGRFEFLEAAVNEQGGDWSTYSADALEQLWSQAKRKLDTAAQ